MTFAYSLPKRYQDNNSSLTKHVLMDVVSGLSRRKQGFDSPWGYLFYKGLDCFLLLSISFCKQLANSLKIDPLFYQRPLPLSEVCHHRNVHTLS